MEAEKEIADGTDTEIFDIEPNNYHMDSKELARRTRYSHAMIDAKILESGRDYSELKNVIVIFILPYDPFGAGLLQYSFETGCKENPEVEYDDGLKTIVFYIGGEKGKGCRKELEDMLSFFVDSSHETAGDDMELVRISDMVDTVRQKPDLGVRYMTMQDRIYFETKDLKKTINEQDKQLAEKDQQLVEKNQQLVEKDARIAELERQLSEAKK